MDTALIRSLLEKNRQQQPYQIRADNSALGAWFQRLGACAAIVRHFTACVTDEDATLPYGTYLGEASLRQAHQDYPQVVDAGFVTIGFGDDGDLIVLDLFTGAAGFISQETIDEGCDREDFEFADDSLSDFMKRDDEAEFEVDEPDAPDKP
jgi:hypothetical protein